jgi:ketosteroid isomerase-like protein
MGTRSQEDLPMATAIDVVRPAFAALDAGAGPVESDVATILRVEDGSITEIVSVSSRALDDYWAEASIPD